MYKYKDAIHILINSFPEIKKVYNEEIEYYEDIPYVFYESIFLKYILERINSSDVEELKSIFIFIEDMLTNGDEEIKNLIEVAIIESLYYEEMPEIRELIRYFGELTKRSFEDCLPKQSK